MFKEKDFFKEYKVIQNSELAVKIIYKQPKFIPAIKNNKDCICGEILSKNEKYSFKLNIENKEIIILYLKQEKVSKIEVPGFINEYLFTIFNNYEYLYNLDDFINLKENNYLYEKFREIKPAIEGALFTSFTGGKTRKYNWCNVKELTKKRIYRCNS